eukprot:jgi/Psemu1/284170/fgenesh1_pg.43_\
MEKKTLRVMFLDIDGVLLPFPNDGNSDGGLFPASTLEPLNCLLRETNASLVLSSTWRVRKDFVGDIVEAIKGYGIDFEGFLDITDPTMHSERQWEIEDWLSKHRAKREHDKIVWLALDDEELIEGDENARFKDSFAGRVVKTKSHKGLTMDDVRDALKLWNSQLSGP